MPRALWDPQLHILTPGEPDSPDLEIGVYLTSPMLLAVQCAHLRSVVLKACYSLMQAYPVPAFSCRANASIRPHQQTTIGIFDSDWMFGCNRLADAPPIAAAARFEPPPRRRTEDVFEGDWMFGCSKGNARCMAATSCKATLAVSHPAVTPSGSRRCSSVGQATHPAATLVQPGNMPNCGDNTRSAGDTWLEDEVSGGDEGRHGAEGGTVHQQGHTAPCVPQEGEGHTHPAVVDVVATDVEERAVSQQSTQAVTGLSGVQGVQVGSVVALAVSTENQMQPSHRSDQRAKRPSHPALL